MTAAAMLLPPYNDFFKVGVSSSGNHDNNIYNQNWSEQYHGLREVAGPVKTAAATGATPDETGADDDPSAADDGQSYQDAVILDRLLLPLQEEDPQGRQRRSQRNGTNSDQTQTTDVNSGEKHFEIHVPTNAEIAGNLKGRLLLVHGDMDDNVHYAGTYRLVDALIRANKRFDYMLMPGKPHGYGDLQPYFTEILSEYFCEHLLGDYYRTNADLKDKGN